MSDPTNAAAPMSPQAPRPDGANASMGSPDVEIRPALHHCECACNRNWGGPCGPCTCEMTAEQMAVEYVDIAARQQGENWATERISLESAYRELHATWARTQAEYQEFRAGVGARTPDPAPSGLTAAQEIRLRLAETIVEIPMGLTNDTITVLGHYAEWVEHGDNTAVCPDPSLHDAINDPGLPAWEQEVLNQRDEAHEQRDKAYEQRDAVEEANRVLGVKFDGANARVAKLERQRDVAEERLSRISGLLAAVEDDPPHGEIPAQAIADVFAWVPEDDRAICAEHGDEGLGDGEATT